MNRYNYPNHYLFRYYNGGYNVNLKGNINVLFVFVNEPNSKWNNKDEKEFLKCAKEGLNNLERLSKDYKINLKFTPSKISYYVNFNQEVDGVLLNTIANDENVIISDNMSFKDYYKANKQYGYDDSIIIFVVNRIMDGLAIIYPNEIKDGLETVLFGRCSFSKTFLSTSLVHEILHLYGAMDLYQPQIVKKLAEQYFPDSIMNVNIINNNHVKTKIDQLTAYLIGWRDTLTKSTCEFLDKTNDVKF